MGAYAQNDDEKEIDIGDVVELIVQVLGYETERRILGSSDLVPDKLLLPVALFVKFVGRERKIYVNVPRLRSWCVLLLTHWAIVRDVSVVIFPIAIGFLFIAGDADFWNSVEYRGSLVRSTLASPTDGGPTHSLDRLGYIVGIVPISSKLYLGHD